MRILIPAYVQPEPQENGKILYAVRPLFFEEPIARDPLLHRALDRLIDEIITRVRAFQDAGDALAIARLAYNPSLKDHRANLHLTLRKHTAIANITLVQFSAMGKRIGLAPRWPDIWFDIPDGQSVLHRASEVFTHHWKHAERHQPQYFQDQFPELSLLPCGSITTLDIQVPPRPKKKTRKPGSGFAIFGGDDGTPSGDSELPSVAQNFNRLYPDELDRAIHREHQVGNLVRALAHDQPRRPVALIGPPKSGKTAIIHEAVRRRMAARPPSLPDYNEVLWHLSPARLIAGMSFVGQWEARVLAILKTAFKRDHVLYFDDMLALYLAGQHSMTDLSVAHVLKPYVERAECRVLAEFTPETWRIFQETDRGFADLFHVIRVEEPDDATTFKILIATARDLERRHNCSFDTDVIPIAHELTHHYQRHVAFPGKAAAFLKGLAVKHPDAQITRQAALEHFHQRSGLLKSILDHTVRLDRDEILASLSKVIVGQDAAVQALADTTLIAKARLNDPGRPLAAMLFLGPTGVGKTQCAKAIATYLFGSSERMVRLDMNEFPGPDAVGRIIGTLAQPEGILTSQVRRQPFCVVLLDEIEKAHPSVFDLLLQVLGEGRLTDSLGRTVDFTNAIIILTSNLGARQAASDFGFLSASPTTADAKRSQTFIHAAEAFFKPEFFNRLDKVIPFDQLTRAQTASIAQGLITQVLSREGLRQRHCVIHIQPQAIDNLVNRGFHPQLGARALRRVVDRELGHKLAHHLAGIAPDAPVAIHVHQPAITANSADATAIQVQPLVAAPQEPLPLDAIDLSKPKHLLHQSLLVLNRFITEIAPLGPKTAITGKNITPDQEAYFSLSSQIADAKHQATGMLDKLSRPPKRPLHQPPSASTACRFRLPPAHEEGVPSPFTLARALGDPQAILQDPAVTPIPNPGAVDLPSFLRHLAYLDLMVDGALNPQHNTILFIERTLGRPDTPPPSPATHGGPSSAGYLNNFHCTTLNSPSPDLRAWRIQGPGAGELGGLGSGSYITVTPNGTLLLTQSLAIPLTPDQPAQPALDAFLSRLDSDPWPIAPVLCVTTPTHHADLRLGALGESIFSHSFALLPLPYELEQ
jgi:ATP-dependent Clp protease ATP-binding subunit ClpC